MPLNLDSRKFPRCNDIIFICGNMIPRINKEFKAIAKNIGGGGLMFETDLDITNGKKLFLEICQPIDNDKKVFYSIPALSKVAWAKKIKKNKFEKGENRYQLGIEFVNINKEDRKKIVEFTKS